MEYYVSKRDFKVHSELKDFIPCDFELAECIASLNERGYETVACCAGHYNPGFYLYQNVKIDELDEYKGDSHVIITEVREDGFDMWSERLASHIYVLFNKMYSFENLPEGFTLEDFEATSGTERCILECDVNYYDENGKMRKMKDVYEELDYRQKKLTAWAKSLPKNK